MRGTKGDIDGKIFTSFPEYRVWCHMIERCHYPKHKSYKRYGCSGVTVCEEWRHNFEQFYKDMGPRPSKDHHIDRIDPNTGYNPENCRWITMLENERRRRGVILSPEKVIELRNRYRESGKSMRAFAEDVEMKYTTLLSALVGENWQDIPGSIGNEEFFRRGGKQQLRKRSDGYRSVNSNWAKPKGERR